MSKAVELRKKRAALIKQCRDLLDRPSTKDGQLDAQDREQYDRMFEEVEELRVEIERHDKLERAEQDVEQNFVVSPQLGTIDGNAGREDKRTEEKKEAQTRAFERYLRVGYQGLNGQERRDLEVGTDADGGFTVPPEDFGTALIKERDNLNFIRKWATVYRLEKAKKLTLPRLASDPSDADWTTELATGNEDSDMAFGQFELDPNPLAKRIKLSKTLLRESALNIQQLVRSRLAYKFGVTEEKAFLTGTGSSQPLGVFTASSSGISTARDIRFASPTAVDADTFKKAKYNMKQGYWPMLKWVMHRLIMQDVALLKDTQGRYLLQPSLASGEPDTVDGFEVYLSEYSPSTKAANAYATILGDFSNYSIVDELNLQMQVLTELYAVTNQIGIIGRLEADGKPSLEEAFTRVQYAAS